MNSEIWYENRTDFAVDWTTVHEAAGLSAAGVTEYFDPPENPGTGVT